MKRTSRIIRQPSSPCLGREREIRRLTRRFREVSVSGEWVVLVRGPAGVGKTRLLEELRSRLRIEGAVVVEGRCSPGMGALAPVSQILHQSLAFLEQVGRAGDVDLSRFSTLLGTEPVGPGEHAGGSPLEQRRRLFGAYYALLRDISRIRPVVVLVHDLHWADGATVELVARLADGAGPSLDRRDASQGMAGLVVASVLAGAETGPVERLASHPRVETMPLGGFDADALREYLSSDHVVDRLLQATGGHPDALEAAVDAAGSAMAVGQRERLDSLGPLELHALAALAALGGPCEASLLARAAGLPNPGISLGNLVEQGLVAKSLQGREVVLRLVRRRCGELAYERLGEEGRRDLHSRIAGLLADARGLESQELAYHALHAGDAVVAVTAALEAASALELTFAFEAAAELLETVMPLAPDGDRDELEERLARLYEALGDHRRALEHARAAARARPEDGAARLTMARLQALSGEPEAAARAVDELIATSLESPDAGLEAGVTRARVEILRARGREELERASLEEARATFGELLELARSNGLEDVEAAALVGLGVAELRARRPEAAEESLGAALDLCRRIGSPRGASAALENLASAAHMRRDYGRALACYDATVADLKRSGDRELLARAAASLAGLYLGLSHRERAASLAALAAKMAGLDPPAELEGMLRLLEGRLALAAGKTGKARELLERATAALGSDEPSKLSEVELALARLELDEGRAAAARRRITALRAEGGLGQAELGEAAMIESDIEEASSGEGLRPALAAADHFERGGDLEGAWRAHLRIARLLESKADDTGAAHHIDRASALESELGATLPSELLEELSSDPDRQLLRRTRGERGGRPIRAAEPPTATDESEVLRPRGRTAGNEGTAAGGGDGIVWRSPAMGRVLDVVSRVASKSTLVLIRGESGTGKELIAEAIHRASPRRDRPLVKVNCGALVETLLLSELFGHEKGAFTGAMQRRRGRFEAAHGGTLFLDEIGDISPATQAGLLRVLQEQQFERVGGSSPIKTDARVICATNRELEALVASGQFREDLYYRLKGLEVRLPPLRERPEDIELLARHFLELACRGQGRGGLSFDDDAMAVLRGHGWPGNVRELENAVRTVAIFVDGPTITAADLARHARLTAGSRPALAPRSAEGPTSRPGELSVDGLKHEILDSDLSLVEAKKRLEKDAAEAALSRTGGNITRAAELLGLTRPRLSQIVKEHGLLKKRGHGDP